MSKRGVKKSKGISPLIGSVLLIAFTIILFVLISTWVRRAALEPGMDFSGEKVATSFDEINTRIGVMEAELINSNTIRLRISNEGSTVIKGLGVRIIGNSGIDLQKVEDLNLQQLDVVISDIVFNDGTTGVVNKVEITPVVSSGYAFSATVTKTVSGGTTSGGTTGCTTNSECDDNLFCTGIETCSSGSCVAGSNPCTDDSNPCTMLCDESIDTCNVPITSCINNDGCCPSGCTNINDNDCSSTLTQTVELLAGDGVTVLGNYISITACANVVTAGQTCLVYPGTYREQVTIQSSGTAGSPVTFKGSDINNKPVINGADLITGNWIDYGTNIWSISLTTDPSEMRFNEIAGQEQGSIVELNVDKEWYHNTTNKILYVYSNSNPGTRFSTIEYPARQYGIYSNAKSFITIDGFEIKRFRKDISSTPVYMNFGSNIIISNNDINEVYYDKNPCTPDCTSWEAKRGFGIYFTGVNNALIYDNYIRDIGSSGITFLAPATDIRGGEIYNNEITNFNIGIVVALGGGATGSIDGVKIHDNYIHDFGNFYYSNAWHRDGIHVYAQPTDYSFSITNLEIYNNVFENSEAISNSSTAMIYLEYNTSQFKIHHNIFHTPPSYSIRIKGSSTSPIVSGNHEIYNNVFYNDLTDDAGSSVLIGNSINNKLKNNIFIVDKLSYAVDPSTGFESDYNTFYKDTVIIDPEIISIPDKNVRWIKFSEIKTYGYELNSVYGLPSFRGDPKTVYDDASIFKLTADPGIDDGANLGFTSDYEGNLIPQGLAPDIGAYENS